MKTIIRERITKSLPYLGFLSCMVIAVLMLVKPDRAPQIITNNKTIVMPNDTLLLLRSRLAVAEAGRERAEREVAAKQETIDEFRAAFQPIREISDTMLLLYTSIRGTQVSNSIKNEGWRNDVTETLKHVASVGLGTTIPA